MISRVKRIGNCQPVQHPLAMLHVFAIEGGATGIQGCCNDQAVPVAEGIFIAQLRCEHILRDRRVHDFTSGTPVEHKLPQVIFGSLELLQEIAAGFPNDLGVDFGPVQAEDKTLRALMFLVQRVGDKCIEPNIGIHQYVSAHLPLPGSEA
ncbi:hypothetical protein [Rhodoferax lacus]|uniref:hypothetical protein n=1 Tax=Rhodoferax lacus TaxID=2184758 RepID=UPI0011C173BA|nr:hypothetical protein [Rhodoferax lacus]